MRIQCMTAVLVVMSVFLMASSRTAVAQSTAAAQVCADILAQYGIAPEGCDPQDDVYQKPKEEQQTTAPTSPTLTASQQELNENNIFFRQGGDKLDTQATQKLDTLGQILNTAVLNTACLRLVGHSDASGAANLNTQMGQKRANVVAQYLGSRLNDARRIQEVKSDGEDSLIPGIAPENALHRRVTIYARKCPSP